MNDFFFFCLPGTQENKKTKKVALSHNLVHCGDQLLLGDVVHRLELLRHHKLHKVAVVLGHHHVHLGRLGRHNLRIDAVLAQVHLGAVSLVDADGGHSARHLHLNALTVHGLERSDAVLKHHSRLLAAVQRNGVDFSLDLHRAVVALVDVHRLLDGGVGDDQVAVVFLVLDSPLLAALQLKHRRLLRSGSSSSLGRRGGLGFVFRLHDRRGTQLRVLVSHLGFFDLLETRRHAFTLGQLREQVAHGRLGRSRGGSGLGRSRSGSGLGGRRSSRCRRGSALGVPHESGGVDLLHVVMQRLQHRHKGLGPVSLLRIRVLEVLQHTVAVELAGANHFLDEGGGLGGDRHPAQSGDALADGTQVVELRAASVVLAKRHNLVDGTGRVAQQRRQLSLGGLLGLGCHCQERLLRLERLVHQLGLSGYVAAHTGAGSLVGLERPVQDLLESFDRGSSGATGSSTAAAASATTAHTGQGSLQTLSNLLQSRHKLSRVRHVLFLMKEQTNKGRKKKKFI
eukprot:m.19255 g.19255  ORF g.19255 m.19255 type:complete len:510 (+) comp10333_c0_seq1:186-1715(+)